MPLFTGTKPQAYTRTRDVEESEPLQLYSSEGPYIVFTDVRATKSDNRRIFVAAVGNIGYFAGDQLRVLEGSLTVFRIYPNRALFKPYEGTLGIHNEGDLYFAVFYPSSVTGEIYQRLEEDYTGNMAKRVEFKIGLWLSRKILEDPFKKNLIIPTLKRSQFPSADIAPGEVERLLDSSPLFFGKHRSLENMMRRCLNLDLDELGANYMEELYSAVDDVFRRAGNADTDDFVHFDKRLLPESYRGFRVLKT